MTNHRLLVMKRIFMLCMLVLIFVNSCTKEMHLSGEQYTFNVNGTLDELPAEIGTKATLGHTMRMTWTKGDAVSVVNLTKGKALGGSLTADKSETTSTFSGTVTGNIDDGDELALIYPNLGFTDEQTFTSAKVDMSIQDGTDKNMKFCVVAVIPAETAGGHFVNADTRFYFKSSTINVTLAELPHAATINKVSFSDLYSGIVLSINSTKDGINATGVNGTINIVPTDGNGVHKTSSQGTRAMYFALGGGKSISPDRRTISVLMGDDLYESDMTGGALSSGSFYTLSVGAFQKKSLESVFTLNYDNSEIEEGETVTIGDVG